MLSDSRLLYHFATVAVAERVQHFVNHEPRPPERIGRTVQTAQRHTHPRRFATDLRLRVVRV